MDPSSDHHSDRYRGKNLLVLLLAVGVPAALLYFRVVLKYIESASRLTSTQLNWLSLSSDIALVLFLVVELLCARYVQRLLKPAATNIGFAVQYLGVFALCFLLSIIGAVLLEGFGYMFFLRIRTASQ